jgi:glycosyltransferase involved in cell wall biosynthesis
VTPPAAVALDCRWLGIGGPGRTTELVLRGLAAGPAPADWVLWGPPAAGELAPAGARLVHIAEDPRLLFGQRHARRLPAARLTVFMHQQRPLRSVPAVTLIYDTIALRYGANRPLRQAKRMFMRRVAAASRHIMTISEHSRRSVIDDLGVAPERISVLRFPVDSAFVDRVAKLRRTLAPEPVALFVGGFMPHKNLPRLLTAFEATRFCRDGGRLVLAGGTAGQVSGLEAALTARQRGFVTAVPASDQAALERLFATSHLLVQPSLEEGFGLPAWEALSCGLRVCASDGGALPEVVAGFVEPFPATDTAAMTAAIDECAGRPAAEAAAMSDRLRRHAPSISQFGEQFRGIVERSLP